MRRSELGVCARRRVFTRRAQRTSATIEAGSRIELTWVRDGRLLTWDHPPASASRERLFVAASAVQVGRISRPTIAGSAGRGLRAGSRSNGGFGCGEAHESFRSHLRGKGQRKTFSPSRLGGLGRGVCVTYFLARIYIVRRFFGDFSMISAERNNACIERTNHTEDIYA